MYGLSRTYFKSAGRLRYLWYPLKNNYKKDIMIIGCGQFSFSTIGYYIGITFGRRIGYVYDIDESRAISVAKFFGSRVISEKSQLIKEYKNTRVVYIASNHSTHTEYAINALNHGKTVYIEKPVSTEYDQFIRLNDKVVNSKMNVYVGYNRPFSQAISKIRDIANSYIAEPISLSCTVVGHKLAADHWYRRPEEGTRICGNAGHWIDLFIHMLSWRGDILSTPCRFIITLNSGSINERDDNFSLSISTNSGDIFSLMLSSRSEPFEGINEQIAYQQGEVTVRIDDFRRMEMWVGAVRHKFKFFPKDVGHEKAVLQPFTESGKLRSWDEIKVSTLIMLFVTRMVRDGVQLATFDTAAELAKLERLSTNAPNPPVS